MRAPVQADFQPREDGIATRAWGKRSFSGHDPFGNPLCFVDAANVFTGGRPA